MLGTLQGDHPVRAAWALPAQALRAEDPAAARLSRLAWALTEPVLPGSRLRMTFPVVGLGAGVLGRLGGGGDAPRRPEVSG